MEAMPRMSAKEQEYIRDIMRERYSTTRQPPTPGIPDPIPPSPGKPVSEPPKPQPVENDPTKKAEEW